MQDGGVLGADEMCIRDSLIPGLEFQLESMTIGSLLSLWFQTLVVGLTMARRTVNTRRYKAYRLLKKLMGGEADD